MTQATEETRKRKNKLTLPSHMPHKPPKKTEKKLFPNKIGTDYQEEESFPFIFRSYILNTYKLFNFGHSSLFDFDTKYLSMHPIRCRNSRIEFSANEWKIE